MVCFSFVSFLVPLELATIKLGIPAVSFLAMVFVMGREHQDLPHVSYMTSVDVHSLLCLVMLALVLLGKFFKENLLIKYLK